MATTSITLSAEEHLIEAAKKRALDEQTTLDEAFSRWLEDYAGRSAQAERALDTLRRIQQYADSGGRKFTREEMNERRLP